MQTFKPFSFLIGADPEFNIVTAQNKKIIAESLVQAIKESPSKEGGIGWDNHKATGEFWPSPTNTVREITENLALLIHRLSSKVPTVSLTTSSLPGWVGGHIHLDVPIALRDNWNTQLFNKISRTLNFFWLLPMLSENPVNVTIRQNKGYGSTNRYEDRCFENGKFTYEFRLPTAEWLTYPKLTEAILAYIGTVWNEIINHDGLNKYSKLVFKNIPQMNNASEMILSHYEPMVFAILKNIKKLIQTSEFYPIYKRQINYLFDYKKILNEKEKLNYNIGIGWKTKNLWFSTAPSFKQQVYEPSIDGCSQTIPIYWNLDFKMKDLKEFLTKKIIKDSITLKRELCLYGLKKGIETFIISSSYGIIQGKEIIDTLQKLDHVGLVTSSMLSKANSKNGIVIGIPYSLRADEKFEEISNTVLALNNKLPNQESWQDISTELYKKLNPPTKPEQIITTNATTTCVVS